MFGYRSMPQSDENDQAPQSHNPSHFAKSKTAHCLEMIKSITLRIFFSAHIRKDQLLRFHTLQHQPY